MKKFEKGHTYLVRVGVWWYIVHQIGQRSWVGLLFSNAPLTTENLFFQGNASGCYEAFEKYRAIGARSMEVHSITSSDHVQLRKAMFNILKTGKIDE